jgi:rsbT antagonist protein RsbS
MKIPILKLGQVLLTSVQIDMTDQDALDFQDAVLTRVQETDAKGVVIDITGLDVVDSFLARVFNDTAQMVRLLGAEVVVCGIRPAVALTLIEMGRELIGVETALNLELGIEKLNQLIAGRTGVAKSTSDDSESGNA